MRKWIAAIAVTLTALIFYPTTPHAAATNPNTAADQTNEKNYHPQKVIVKYKRTYSEVADLQSNTASTPSIGQAKQRVRQLHKKLRIKNQRPFLSQANAQRMRTSAGRLRPRAAQVQQLIEDCQNIHIMEVEDGIAIEDVIEEYSKDPSVEYVQPDYEMVTYLIPNDYYYGTNGSWGQAFDDLWGVKAFGMEPVWDTTQGAGIVVAVLDTGIDLNHEDIDNSRIWSNTGEIGGNGIDDDGNGYVDDIMGWDFVNDDNNPHDGHGHGSHVSGTVLAHGQNTVGLIGVAPQATLMPLKGLSDAGSGSSDGLAAGLIYAAMNGADVINNSWGCRGTCPSNPIVEDAVRIADGLGMAVVFAAGNSVADVRLVSPQNMKETISVGVLDHNLERAIFSNYGFRMDVSAPGVEILSVSANDGANTIINQRPEKAVDGNYMQIDGTSMAAPHVAGVVALMRAVNPSWTPQTIREVLKVTATDLAQSGVDLSFGSGLVDPAAALTYDPAHLLAVDVDDQLEGQVFNTDLVTSISVNGSVNGATLQDFQAFYTRVDVTGTFTSAWTAFSPVFTAPVSDGHLGDIDITGFAPGIYAIKIVATNIFGETFEDHAHVTVTITYDILNTLGGSVQQISGDWVYISQRIKGSIISIYNRYLYNVVTTEVIDIEARVGHNVSNAELSGNFVALKYHDGTNEQFALYDIINDTLTTIFTRVGDPFVRSYEHSNERVAWMLDYRNTPRDMDLNIYDVITGDNEVVLSKTGPLMLTYGMEDSSLVWNEGEINQLPNELHLYDIDTNVEQILTTCPVEYAPSSLSAKLSGEWFAYSSFDIGWHICNINTGAVLGILSDFDSVDNVTLHGDFIYIAGVHVDDVGDPTDYGYIYDMVQDDYKKFVHEGTFNQTYGEDINGTRLIYAVNQPDDPSGDNEKILHVLDFRAEDAVPPTVQLTNLTDGDFVGGMQIITADADDDWRIDRVDFYLDGQQFIGTADTAPYSISFDFFSIGYGEHTIEARAYDWNTNATVSTVLNIVVDSSASQTPWKTNANGTQVTDVAWNYTMGYHFTPQKDGIINKLGALVNGTKEVRLYNRSTGDLLASTMVTGANDWAYGSISPVVVEAGAAYTVAVVLNGSGGSYRLSSHSFPSTFSDIRIDGTTWFVGDGRPTNNYTFGYMFGQADIGFIPVEATQQTPWDTNESGTIVTGLPWEYTMGYHFTPQRDGLIDQIGGYFDGAKEVFLWDKASGALLATTSLTSSNGWSYIDIPPVLVEAGREYTVGVYLAGTGGSYQFVSPSFPQTYGDITIKGTTFQPGNVRPTNSWSPYMFGQVDIRFTALDL